MKHEIILTFLELWDLFYRFFIETPYFLNNTLVQLIFFEISLKQSYEGNIIGKQNSQP